MPHRFSANRAEAATVIGMSAIFILHGDPDGKYLYLSDSFRDILGYDPQSLIGVSCYTIFHPDEIPVLISVHMENLVYEQTACVTYMRVLHKSGHYVNCAVSYSTVYDKTVGTITRAENGPLTIKHAATAREVYEVQCIEGGTYTIRKWPRTRASPGRSPSPPAAYRALDNSEPWQGLPDMQPRTAFLIDRFTDTSRVIYVTNDVFLHTNRLKDQSFYSIVKPSDRTLVKEYIDNAKSWSPVVHDERRSGGHSYAEFEVLRIPDLPPHGELYPQGTDESERHMPGQGFILVEGIFIASSDGVICIIERIDKKREKSVKKANGSDEMQTE